MSRSSIIITLLFVVGAGAIYLSLGNTPVFQNQTPPELSLPTTPPSFLSPDIQKSEVHNAELRGLIGTSASGTVKWRAMNGAYAFGLSIQKLAQPPEGTFYAAWLIDGKNTFLIGKLERIEVGEYEGDYTLGVTTQENLTAFKKVMVTLETKDDTKPEKPIMEGNFAN